MQAQLMSTQGYGLQASIEIDAQRYVIRDTMSVCAESMPSIGDSFDFQFSNTLDESQSWDSIFGGNPERKKGIEQIEGYAYQAFGQIISIDPVKVNCGILIQENVVHPHDPIVVGAYISFTIVCLSGYAQKTE